MDRETRKANLKKLRLSGVKHVGERNNIRKTRSDNESISKYFRIPITNEVKYTKPDDDIETDFNNKLWNAQPLDSEKTGTNKDQNLEKCVNAKSRKRTSITNFVLKEGKNIEDKTQEDSETCVGVFEIPQKKVKIRDKLRSSKKNIKSSKSHIPNNQLDIKTSLMRSEQIFSEITSQHCRVDNFSADEILLALALSKSQVETNGEISLDSTEGGADQHVENKVHDSWRNVPNILRQYGFRTTSQEDYNSLASVFVPGANRRTKTKWVNKFTALTLRDSKLQASKVRFRVESLMAQQLNFKAVKASESQFTTYSLISGELQKLKIVNVLANRLETKEKINVEDFYVINLFEVAHKQAGCLLKDWHTIQGRDRSPRGDNRNQNKNIERKLNLIYMALDEHFGQSGKLKPNETSKNIKELSIKDEETKAVELKSLYETTSVGSTETNNGKQSVSLSPDSSESYIREANLFGNNIGSPAYSESVTGCDLASDEIFNPKDRDNFHICVLKSNYCSTSQSISDNHHTKAIKTRTLSPNIFASSEDESGEVTNTIMTTSNNHDSSDGPFSNDTPFQEYFKTSSNISHVIDLTQEGEQPNVSLNIPSFVSEDIPTKRVEALNNNFEAVDWSNKNFIKIDSGLYERKAFSLTEINLLGIQSSANRKHFNKIVDESSIWAKRLTMSSDDTTSKAGKKNVKYSMWNSKKSASLPCILSHLYLSHNTSYEHSIDAIQNEESEACDDCIVLSDDEINYSIWKADMSRDRGELMRGDTQSAKRYFKKKGENSHNFSKLDLMDGENFMENNTNMEIDSNDIMLTCDDLEVPNNVSFLSRATGRTNDLLEFGILDNTSESYTQEFHILKMSLHQAKLNDNLTPTQNKPAELGKLLTGEIFCPKKSYSHAPLLTLCNYPPDEYEISGRMYTIRMATGRKPNFIYQTEAEILKQLYEFGIKPLKRKQAIKMLEYIYNSTHPLVLAQTADSKVENVSKAASDEEPEGSIPQAGDQIGLASNILQINSCLSSSMLQFTKDLQIDFKYEDCIFQTNVTKKTPRPLLPLHIAWYNLVSSSTILHEMILMFEPIDLHEIYLFFKQLGYRFELKDMKIFLDRRCIIFRYDLAQPGRQSARHIRISKTMAKKK